MARLTDLADELLSLIFSHLDQPSLASLALVASRCYDVAQEMLFQKVSVLADNDREREWVVSLVSTLSRRADLAAKIRQLSFHITSGQFSKTSVSKEHVSAALRFVSSVKDMDEEELLEHADQYPDETWYGGIPDGAVTPYLAVLLGLVPNLERVNMVDRREGEECFSLPALFGAPENDCDDIPNIDAFTGLRSLHTLRIHGHNFLLATWYMLPNLRRLELDCYQNYFGMEIDTQAHHEPDLEVLHTVLVRCSTLLLLPLDKREVYSEDGGWWDARSPFQSLRYFTLPECLEIEIINVARLRLDDSTETDSMINDGFIVNESNPGSFAIFFEEMQALKRTLKTSKSLSIRVNKNDKLDDGLDFMAPANSLAFLTSTKELTIPRQVILHPKDSAQGDSRPNLAEFLPTKLETLCVLEPDFRILAWFKQILDVRHIFSAFTKLYLEFENDAACEELEAHCRIADHTGEQFRAMGIDVLCRCHGRSFVPWNMSIG